MPRDRAAPAADAGPPPIQDAGPPIVGTPNGDSRDRAVPPTSRGKRTRQALLDAAEAVFGERGFHQATIVEITQRAGVALGTFYLYFPDKKAAFDELVRTLNRTMRQEIRRAVAGLGDRLEVESLGFETFFKFVRRHRNLYRIIRQAEFVDEALYRWHYETMARGYVRGLMDAQRRGQIRADVDPETIAYALMAMAETLGLRWVLWEDRLPGVEVRESIRSFLRGGLASRGDRR